MIKRIFSVLLIFLLTISAAAAFSLPTAADSAADDIESKLNDLKQKAGELSSMMDECGKAGLSVDYERVNYATIVKFTDIMREDYYEYGEYDRALGYYDKLISLYEESRGNMESYLDGTALPKSVPQLADSNITVNGGDITAKTETDGVIREQSVFLNGYGHFMYPKNDYDKFGDFGANSVVMSAKLYDVVTQKNPAKYWNIYEYGNVYDYAAERSFEEKHGGSCSLKYSRSDAYGTKKTFYVRQTVDIKPGATYTFGLWAKGVNAKKCSFSGHPVIDSNYGLSQRTEHDLSGTYDWTNFEFTYTAKDDEYLFEILIPCSNATEALYIDDVYVRRAGSDENLIKNPGFEEAETSESEFGIYDGHIKKLVHDMDYAYENRLSVNIGLGIHYMPDYIITDYPDIKDSGGTYPSYMGYNPTHPKVKEMISAFLSAVIPAIRNHPALTSVCIANEPNFQCFNTSYYEPLWQNYLFEKYLGDIDAFNSLCKTEYSDFKSIKFADAEDYNVLKNQLYRYNDTIMTDYLTFIANEVKSLAPEIKIFAKNLPAIRAHGKKSLAHGINIETMTGIFDVNGCDAMHYYYHSEYPLQAKTEWYDLLTSVEDLPIFNTEDHLIRDGKTLDLSGIITSSSYADMWQGAVHGRRQSIVWLWDRDKEKITNSYMNANMLLRPDIVANNGKLFLDMQRLSKELSALSGAKRDVAILYSYDSLTYVPSYLSSVYQAYTNTLYLGKRPLFVTESQIDKLFGCSVLIIPEAVSVTDETYSKIVEFKQNGGKIVMMGENSLSADEFLRARNTDEVKSGAAIVAVKATANEEISQAVNLSDTLKSVFDEAGIRTVKLFNALDGSTAADTEYTVGSLNGAKIVNLCNYGDTAKTVYITDGGETVESSAELLSGKAMQRNIVLEPYKPVMIRYAHGDSLTLDRVSGDNTIISTSPVRLKNAMYRISASSGGKSTLYIAMYKGGRLCGVRQYPVESAFDSYFYINADSGEYDTVKAMLWYKDTLVPVMENIEIASEEESVITNVSRMGNMCYIFGKIPQISGRVSVTVYSADGRLEYIDQTESDSKGNFKFIAELSDASAQYDARVKLSSGKTVSFLIN